MGFLFDVLSLICLVGGSAFALIGGIGIIRLPDFFARLHGGGITDTLGAGLIVLGLMLQAIKVGLTVDSGSSAVPWLVFVKLLMVLLFLFVTSPTGGHALARAALSDGVEPVVANDPVVANGEEQTAE